MIGYDPIGFAPISLGYIGAPGGGAVEPEDPPPGVGGSVLPVCIACIMSARPINLHATMSSAAINLTVSF